LTDLPITLSVRIEKAILVAEENIKNGSIAAHLRVREQPSIRDALAVITEAETEFYISRDEAEALRQEILKSGPASDVYKKYLKDLNDRAYGSLNIQSAIHMVQKEAAAELISLSDAEAIVKKISRHGVDHRNQKSLTVVTKRKFASRYHGHIGWIKTKPMKAALAYGSIIAVSFWLWPSSPAPRKPVNVAPVQTEMFAKGQLVSVTQTLEIGSGASAITIEAGTVFQILGPTCAKGKGHTARDTRGQLTKAICIPDSVVKPYP
jgi:hypothetical protein